MVAVKEQSIIQRALIPSPTDEPRLLEPAGPVTSLPMNWNSSSPSCPGTRSWHSGGAFAPAPNAGRSGPSAKLRCGAMRTGGQQTLAWPGANYPIPGVEGRVSGVKINKRALKPGNTPPPRGIRLSHLEEVKLIGGGGDCGLGLSADHRLWVALTTQQVARPPSTFLLLSSSYAHSQRRHASAHIRQCFPAAIGRGPLRPDSE